jgi:hypothetical protein
VIKIGRFKNKCFLTAPMTLENLISKINETNKKTAEKFGQLHYASLAFLTIRGVDVATTYLALNNNDSNKEMNPLTKYFMDQFGTGIGLGVKNMLIITGIMGATYLMHKLDKKTKVKTGEIMGSVLLYAGTLDGLCAVINNLNYL